MATAPSSSPSSPVTADTNTTPPLSSSSSSVVPDASPSPVSAIDFFSLCHQLKVEMILQALDYEEDEQGRDLYEFLRSTAGKFQTEIGKAWASEIVSRRNNTILP